MSSRLRRYTSSPDQTFFFEEHLIALPLAPNPQDRVQQGSRDRDDRSGTPYFSASGLAANSLLSQAAGSATIAFTRNTSNVFSFEGNSTAL